METDRYSSIVFWFYATGFVGTFAYLTFFAGFVYNAWNWILAIPMNLFLAAIFPLYWGAIHWLT